MRPLRRLFTPRKFESSGDDSAAASIWRYVWRMTGWHQVTSAVIAVLVAVLNLIPIELQRRIVNEVVETQNVPLLIQFGIIYLSVLLVHQLTKFGLHMYQVWLSESTAITTRNHLFKLHGKHDTDVDDSRSGRVVSIVGSEVEKLSGFVGEAISQAFVNTALLLGVIGYMFVVEPGIAVFALAFMIPQVVITPLMQRKLNDLVEDRVEMVRDMGDTLSEEELSFNGQQGPRILKKIFDNRIHFTLLKFALKGMLNILSALGPLVVLVYGGYLVMQGETQVGVIVAFISGFERINSPVRELVAFYRAKEQAKVQHDMVAKWIARVTG